MRINPKTGASYYSTEALLYWQKAADTMLWKKAYAVMDDGSRILKEGSKVQ